MMNAAGEPLGAVCNLRASSTKSCSTFFCASSACRTRTISDIRGSPHPRLSGGLRNLVHDGDRFGHSLGHRDWHQLPEPPQRPFPVLEQLSSARAPGAAVVAFRPPAEPGGSLLGKP